MCLHPKKTKYLIVTTRQKRQNFSHHCPPLYINGEVVEEVDNHKILGVVIDNNLSWSGHIKHIRKILSKKVHQLSRIKHFLNLHSRKMFFHAYIESHINYASTVWDNASENVLKPLLSLHRRAIKLILSKSSSLSASDYTNLDILPLKSKFRYNKALFMFKIMSDQSPSLKHRFTTSLARHKHKIKVPLPRLDLFKSSLAYSGGCLWNDIISSFNVQVNISAFKKMYRAHLMNSVV